MQGDAVKALKILSRAKGWDPDRIWDAKTQSYEGSIENFNKPPQIYANQAGTGRLPQGVPDTFPEAEQPRYEENTLNDDGVTWNTPDYRRETKNHRTNNAGGR